VNARAIQPGGQLERKVQPARAQNNQRNEDDDAYGFLCDCDDRDPDVNVDADEVCDGVDNDCDGYIDEDPVDGTTYYADTDADQEGDPNNTIEGCEPPVGYTSNSDDCDDNDAATHSAAVEICDGIDNNCNGEIDDGAECDDLEDALAKTRGCSCDVGGPAPASMGWLVLLGAVAFGRRRW
jgi:MYXO-CTERM domain-containing protein